MNQGVQGKCTATLTRTTPFSKEKGTALGGTRTHDSSLPTELPGQLSRQGSKSTTQHNTHYCTNISEVVVQRAMSEGVPQEIVESLLNKRRDYTPAT